MVVVESRELDARRSVAAEAAYEDFDFGTRTVEGANGWERSVGGSESTPDDATYKRIVFLSGDDDGADSDAVTFAVRFRPTSDDVYDAGVVGW